eukprot:jgi/Psemu1/4796/gm1.4796_g
MLLLSKDVFLPTSTPKESGPTKTGEDRSMDEYYYFLTRMQHHLPVNQIKVFFGVLRSAGRIQISLKEMMMIKQIWRSCALLLISHHQTTSGVLWDNCRLGTGVYHDTLPRVPELMNQYKSSQPNQLEIPTTAITVVATLVATKTGNTLSSADPRGAGRKHEELADKCVSYRRQLKRFITYMMIPKILLMNYYTNVSGSVETYKVSGTVKYMLSQACLPLFDLSKLNIAQYLGHLQLHLNLKPSPSLEYLERP